MTAPTDTGRDGDGLPRTERDARRWVRAHWAAMIRHADMGGVADLECDALDAVWGDECKRIADRMAPQTSNEITRLAGKLRR